MIEVLTFENLVAYVLQSSALIVVALTALRILHIDAASVRYSALRVTLALALALPLLQPRVNVASDDAVNLSAARTSATPTATAPAAQARRTALSRSNATVGPWIPFIAPVLFAGIVGRWLWLSAGLWRLQRLRRAGETAAGDEYADLQDVIGAIAELRYVAGLEQPLTFGVRRPIVLLPDTLHGMVPPIRRAVVAHELWHVQRRDWLWMVGEEAVRAAFWFHPAMWILLSRIQVAREETVDELAVLTTGSRRAYLDALLTFADRRPLFATAAFARRRHLLHRMLTISKENVMSSTRIVASCGALAVAVVATAWSAAAAFPLQTPPRDSRQPPGSRAHEMVFVAASEAEMQEAIRREPKNAAHYRALANYYLKAGDFDRAVGTLEALELADPANPEHHHTVAVFYWEKAARDAALSREQKTTYLLSGIAADDRALAINPDYMEALTYKNIMLRLLATYTPDIAEQRRLLEEANTLRSRAMELAKQRGVGAGVPGAPPPPPPPPQEFGPVDGMMPVRVGGNVAPPTKIRDVRPVYPPEAQMSKLSGMVILEILVDTSGGVRAARVLRSVPPFDEAALAAVQQWQFTPTLVDGVARPAIMTVTVNFTLK